MPDQPSTYHCDLCGSDSHPTEVHQKAENKEEKQARVDLHRIAYG